MKKLILLVLIPLFAVSLAFSEDPVSVEQKTENKASSSQLKNRIRTREHRQKNEVRKEMRQNRKQVRENRKGPKAGR
ncbi:MAG: hypothetical protein JXA20_09540 [Spirochaetes bacterium]|nr:hypothetical protein [Spirochaetota bacterium]